MWPVSVEMQVSHSEEAGKTQLPGQTRPVKFPDQQPLQMGEAFERDIKARNRVPLCSCAETRPAPTLLGVPESGTEMISGALCNKTL